MLVLHQFYQTSLIALFGSMHENKCLVNASDRMDFDGGRRWGFGEALADGVVVEIVGDPEENFGERAPGAEGETTQPDDHAGDDGVVERAQEPELDGDGVERDLVERALGDGTGPGEGPKRHRLCNQALITWAMAGSVWAAGL